MIALPYLAMGLQAAGGLQSAAASRAAGEYSAQVDEANAVRARYAAGDAEARGQIEAGQARTQGSQVIGKARAGAAANGIDVSSANVVDIVGSTRLMSELDVATIRNNARREAYGELGKAESFSAQAQLSRMRGEAGSTSTLLGTLGSMVGTGYSTGLFPKLGK